MSQASAFRPAIVVDNLDPDNLGRVKVRLESGKGHREVWARIATLMAGNNRGTWFIPDVNDEVLLAFAGDAPQEAYVIGGLWNATRLPPETMQPDNDRKVLRSRSGLKITFDDQNGHERILVETPSGQKISLADGPGEIEITDSNGNAVKLHSAGIDINAAANVSVNCGEVKISAATMTVDAGVSVFSGVIKCDTLISNSVISASYSPGAGNIW